MSGPDEEDEEDGTADTAPSEGPFFPASIAGALLSLVTAFFNVLPA